eukprot:4815907-Pyramimonas_sp.AAC.1
MLVIARSCILLPLPSRSLVLLRTVHLGWQAQSRVPQMWYAEAVYADRRNGRAGHCELQS